MGKEQLQKEVQNLKQQLQETKTGFPGVGLQMLIWKFIPIDLFDKEKLLEKAISARESKDQELKAAASEFSEMKL